MNLGLLLATFGLVIPAELPDKTFISCVVMASRHRPVPVWIGGATALIAQAGLAVVAGRALELLPRTAVRSVVAGLFVAGALYLIAVPERVATEKGERIGGREDADLAGQVAAPGWRIALLTFSLVALAEFGDITQILIANLTARYHAAWSVFAGAAAAFVLVSGLGVLGGRTLVRVVPLALVRRLSGLVLLGLGIYTIVGLL